MYTPLLLETLNPIIGSFKADDPVKHMVKVTGFVFLTILDRKVLAKLQPKTAIWNETALGEFLSLFIKKLISYIVGFLNNHVLPIFKTTIAKLLNKQLTEKLEKATKPVRSILFTFMGIILGFILGYIGTQFLVKKVKYIASKIQDKRFFTKGFKLSKITLASVIRYADSVKTLLMWVLAFIIQPQYVANLEKKSKYYRYNPSMTVGNDDLFYGAFQDAVNLIKTKTRTVLPEHLHFYVLKSENDPFQFLNAFTAKKSSTNITIGVAGTAYVTLISHDINEQRKILTAMILHEIGHNVLGMPSLVNLTIAGVLGSILDLFLEKVFGKQSVLGYFFEELVSSVDGFKHELFADSLATKVGYKEYLRKFFELAKKYNPKSDKQFSKDVHPAATNRINFQEEFEKIMNDMEKNAGDVNSFMAKLLNKFRKKKTTKKT